MSMQQKKSNLRHCRADLPAHHRQVDFDATSNILVIDLADNVPHAYAARFHSISFSPMNGANRVRVTRSRRRSICCVQPPCRCMRNFSRLASGMHCDSKVYRTLARSIAEPPDSHTRNWTKPEPRRQTMGA